MNKEELIEKAYDVRKNVLRMGHVDKRGFIAQSLGAADFLTVLYFHAMKYHADDPKWEGRDRFLLSAGHNAIAVYAAMAEAGFFPKDWLDTYGLDNSRLPMSCMPAYTPGIEISGGSIGLGMPIAVGMAMGLKRKGSDSKVYVMMGDGEMAEGPTWEAAMSAGSYGLDNIIGIVDVKTLFGVECVKETQTIDMVIKLEDWDKDKEYDRLGLTEEYTEFLGNKVVNGNSITQVMEAVDKARFSTEKKPHIILCDTVPGTGLSFLIGNPKAHFISLSDEDWTRAFNELERGKD